jgi:hypothetical protein
MSVRNVALACKSRFFAVLGAAFCLLGIGGAAQAQQGATPGKIPSEFSVSPSGAATYRIPVEVPPGVGGMEPKLALVYNSQAGNGPLGLGWSLEGLSAITRCPATMATDGLRGAITHTQQDRFCLDGQRLINVAGNYGAARSEYRTEIDSFSQIRVDSNVITYHGSGSSGTVTVDNGPRSFTVKTKDGLTLEYGNSEDSRVEAQGKSAVRVWALNRMTDVKGNYVRYFYQENNANGSHRIERIEYGGLSSVLFEYASRPDTVLAYQAGSVMRISELLSSIKVVVGSAVERQIGVFYLMSDEVPKINTVEVCSRGSSCFKPFRFSYYPRQQSAGLFNSSLTDWGYEDRRWWVDFNGDGLPDYCRAVGNSGGAGSFVGCSLSNGAGLATEYSVLVQLSDWGYSDRRWWVDFNGDGRADYCRAVGSSSGAGSYLGCSLSTGTGIAGEYSVFAPLSDWGYADRRWWVDFDGDGRTDFCRAVGNGSGSGSYLGCSLSTGAGLSGEYSVFAALSDWGYADRRWWIDFNGDGRPDYCRAVGNSSGSGSRLACSLSNGAGLSGEVSALVSDWGYEDRRWWIDFNGDGLADFCRAVGSSSGAGSFLACSLSTGSGLSGEYTVFTPLADWGYADRRWWVDVNGDGRSDFCRAVGQSSGAGSQLACSLSTGTGFSGEYSILVPMTDWGYSDRRWWNDMDGDGRPEFCRATGNSSGAGSQLSCSTVYVSAPSDKLKMIVEGDRSIDMTFVLNRSLAASSGYPLIGVAGGWVVNSVVASNGIGVGGFGKTNYSYGDAKAEHASPRHPGSGRGMLGFAWMKAKEESTGIETRTDFSQQWPFVGQVVRSETRLGDRLLKQSIAQMDCRATAQAGAGLLGNASTGCAWQAGKVYFPFVSLSEEQSWDLNGAVMPRIRTTSSYNGVRDTAGVTRQLGDPTTVMVDIYEGNTLRHRKTTTNEYLPADVSTWSRLGRLSKASVTSSSWDSGGPVLVGAGSGASGAGSGAATNSSANALINSIIMQMLMEDDE